MKVKRECVGLMAIIFILTCLFVSPAFSLSKKEKMRKEIRIMVQNTLSKLYRFQPQAKDVLRKAAGYAVFSNFGMKIFLLGGGKGEGLAHNNRTGQDVFMKMVEIQGGLGLGIKKFSLVWVFQKEKDFNEFIDTGLELSAQYTAAAKDGKAGDALAGAITIRPGVWLYQLTEKGLALELTAKGTKYYKDSDLN